MKSFATLRNTLIAGLTLSTSATAVWASCGMTSTAEAIRSGCLDGGNIDYRYSPDPITSCRGSLNPFAGCYVTMVPNMWQANVYEAANCGGMLIRTIGPWQSITRPEVTQAHTHCCS